MFAWETSARDLGIPPLSISSDNFYLRHHLVSGLKNPDTSPREGQFPLEAVMTGQGSLLTVLWGVKSQWPSKPWGLLLPLSHGSPRAQPSPRDSLCSHSAPARLCSKSSHRQRSWGFQFWQDLGRDHNPQTKIQVILNPLQLPTPTV